MKAELPGDYYTESLMQHTIQLYTGSHLTKNFQAPDWNFQNKNGSDIDYNGSWVRFVVASAVYDCHQPGSTPRLLAAYQGPSLVPCYLCILECGGLHTLRLCQSNNV